MKTLLEHSRETIEAHRMKTFEATPDLPIRPMQTPLKPFTARQYFKLYISAYFRASTLMACLQEAVKRPESISETEYNRLATLTGIAWNRVTYYHGEVHT